MVMLNTVFIWKYDVFKETFNIQTMRFILTSISILVVFGFTFIFSIPEGQTLKDAYLISFYNMTMLAGVLFFIVLGVSAINYLNIFSLGITGTIFVMLLPVNVEKFV